MLASYFFINAYIIYIDCFIVLKKYIILCICYLTKSITMYVFFITKEKDRFILILKYIFYLFFIILSCLGLKNIWTQIIMHHTHLAQKFYNTLNVLFICPSYHKKIEQGMIYKKYSDPESNWDLLFRRELFYPLNYQSFLLRAKLQKKYEL